jgi:hypothetical protein
MLPEGNSKGEGEGECVASYEVIRQRRDPQTDNSSVELS